jgi:pimeloyl-ACP methyl ester carboxylesterase
MAGKYDARVDFELSGLQAHGLFLEGKHDLRSSKPLVVLIHGGGANAQYFDNKAFSYLPSYSHPSQNRVNMMPGFPKTSALSASMS